MKKYYCDGCECEIMDMPLVHNGFCFVPLIEELDGIKNKNKLVVDSKEYDLCKKCRSRIKDTVKREIESIKGESHG